ncbi:MAG: GlsB/YeaQ/YmgE family stress response membrane protein [Gemmatirosa sp.]
MGILAWIILGLIAGAIAKALMPGKDPGGFIVTALIGIVGAVIGGFLGNMIFGIGGVSGIDIRSILISVVGALVLLWIYRMATRRSTV